MPKAQEGLTTLFCQHQPMGFAAAPKSPFLGEETAG